MTKGHIHVHLKSIGPLADRINYFYRIIAALTNNPHVTNLTPTLAVAKAHVDTLAASNINVKTVGSAQRNADLDVVDDDMESFRHAVEVACNANPALADVIAQSAEMLIQAHPGPRPKDAVQAGLGDTPDQIVVRLKASDNPKAAYETAYSLDNGITYVSIGVSTFAHNTIKGMQLGAILLIRARTIIGNVPGPWSEPIRYVVH